MNELLKVLENLLNKVDEKFRSDVEKETEDFLKVYKATKNNRTLECFLIYLQTRVEGSYTEEAKTQVQSILAQV